MANLRNHCIRCGLELPPVYVTTCDFGRLESLARLRPPAHARAAALLAAELERAIVCPPDQIMEDVVTMGAGLSFAPAKRTDPVPRRWSFRTRITRRAGTSRSSARSARR